MNCLEFKRLALSDPYSRQHEFVEHSQACADCLKYIGGVRKMDADLADSLQVTVPANLVARLKLNQELGEDDDSNVERGVQFRRYAIAASLALGVFVAGFMASNQLGLNQAIEGDYQSLLTGIVEHMHEHPMTQVVDASIANRDAQTLLASYDSEMKLKYLSNLQFTKVCPMGRYRGIHATLDTPDGQVTFAYIKGDSIGQLLDVSYEGLVTRVKPVRGGNLVILSRTNSGLQQADQQLQEAIYWET